MRGAALRVDSRGLTARLRHRKFVDRQFVRGSLRCQDDFSIPVPDGQLRIQVSVHRYFAHDFQSRHIEDDSGARRDGPETSLSEFLIYQIARSGASDRKEIPGTRESFGQELFDVLGPFVFPARSAVDGHSRKLLNCAPGQSFGEGQQKKERLQPGPLLRSC